MKDDDLMGWVGLVVMAFLAAVGTYLTVIS